MTETTHNPVARYCTIVGLPPSELSDTATCPACDELRALVRLDPDFAEEMAEYDTTTDSNGGTE